MTPVSRTPPQQGRRAIASRSTCRCCDRHIFEPAAQLCGYCDARPDQGGCLGYHGEALRAYLDDRCAHGACTPELAEWWLGQDVIHLTRHRSSKIE